MLNLYKKNIVKKKNNIIIYNKMNLQDFWNTIFKYAFPLSFIGSMFYGILSMFQLEPTAVFTNKNWLSVFNIFIGVCGFLSFAVWFHTDLTTVNSVTSLIGLDANVTRDSIEKPVP